MMQRSFHILGLGARVLAQGSRAETSFLGSLLSLRSCATATDEETIDFGFQRVPKQQKASLVGDVFSKVATSYDTMNDVMTGGLHRQWKDQMVDSLRPFPGMRHLDVAGGTGDVAFRVLRAIRAAEAHHGVQSRRKHTPMNDTSTSSTIAAAALGISQAPAADTSSGSPQGSGAPAAGAGSSHQAGRSGVQPGCVYVCDINPQMLAEGRRKAAMAPDLAGDPGLIFELGNAEALSQFPDGSFDAYTIAFGIRNVTHRMKALQEAYRVLRPGGRFLCMEFSHVSQPVLREAYDAYSFAVIPRMGELVAGDHASYQYLVESIREFPNQETWADMIEQGGFRRVGYDNILGGIVALHSGYKLA